MLVAAEGAVGSVLRYLLGFVIKQTVAVSFPVATLVINVTGSLFIGLLFAYFQHHTSFNLIRPPLIIGLLGGFTTFYAFSFKVIELMENKQITKALLYVFMNNTFGISAAYIGYKLAS